MNVVLIVDMQHRYHAARNVELIARINAAMANLNDRIVILATDGSGQHTIDYDGRDVIWKPEGDSDGGAQVYAYLVGAGLVDEAELRVTVAGVNTAHCVYRTACSLADRLAQEDGITDAVSIDLNLCDDDEQFRVSFIPKRGADA